MGHIFHTTIILGAVALPLLAFAPDAAHADTPRDETTKSLVPASGTLREVITRGSVLILEGFGDIDVAYTPDGKFTAMEGQVKGTWRVEGESLCTTTNVQPAESCALYPRDKKSGDTFEIMSDQGLVKIRIK